LARALQRAEFIMTMIAANYSTVNHSCLSPCVSARLFHPAAQQPPLPVAAAAVFSRLGKNRTPRESRDARRPRPDERRVRRIATPELLGG
jgi:hypothetical protein